MLISFGVWSPYSEENGFILKSSIFLACSWIKSAEILLGPGKNGEKIFWNSKNSQFMMTISYYSSCHFFHTEIYAYSIEDFNNEKFFYTITISKKIVSLRRKPTGTWKNWPQHIWNSKAKNSQFFIAVILPSSVILEASLEGESIQKYCRTRKE